METVIDHHIEPDVAGPPPRATRLPGSTTALLALAALLFGLFLFGGSRALWESVKLAWLGVAGHPVTAHIISVDSIPGPTKGSPPRQSSLRYAFPVAGGALQTGYARLATGEASGAPVDGPPYPGSSRNSAVPPPPPDFHVGDPLPFRYAAWPGGIISHVWSPAPYGQMVFLTLAGALVVGVSLLLLRRIARWHRGRLYLLRQGVATVGTIVHKHATADDTLRYFLRYGYAYDGATHEHEEQCNPDQWKRFEVGQPVTVLYDPAQPDNACLYTLMGRK